MGSSTDRSPPRDPPTRCCWRSRRRSTTATDRSHSVQLLKLLLGADAASTERIHSIALEGALDVIGRGHELSCSDAQVALREATICLQEEPPSPAEGVGGPISQGDRDHSLAEEAPEPDL